MVRNGRKKDEIGAVGWRKRVLAVWVVDAKDRNAALRRDGQITGGSCIQGGCCAFG
jgi:hypothetical protein